MQLRLYRYAYARPLLNTVLVSAVSSILLLRWYLNAHGWPTIGGAHFHIAHMLWGGLLMLAALLLLLSYLGRAVTKLAAVIGGAGFGIFIDELGKFITRDTNYWYQPTVGLIYAVFVLVYLASEVLTRREKLTSREYQLNAILQLEEAVASDLDPVEKKRVEGLLAQADQDDPLTHGLRRLLAGISTTDVPKKGALRQLADKLEDVYIGFYIHKNSDTLVQVLFVAQAVIIVLSAAVMTLFSVALVTNVIGLPRHDEAWTNVGQLVGSGASALAALYGVVAARSSRLRMLDWFERAIMINLLFTEFFAFTRWEFWALPGLGFNLLLLVIVNLAQYAEQRRLS